MANATTQLESQNSSERNDEDQNGQRKRQKINSENQILESNTKPQLLSKQTTGTTTQKPGEITNPAVLPPKTKPATQRPISPPPLRRNLQNGTSTLTKPSNISSTNPTTLDKPVASPATPKIQKSLPASTPLKKESLIPRARKTAPALFNIRHRLIQALHEQFERLNTELSKDANDSEEELVLSEQALITKALDVEESACETPTIYSNVVKNKILQYKRMTVSQWKTEREQELAKEKKKSAVPLSDTPTAKPTGPPKSIETGLTTEQEVVILPRLYTPIKDLAKHGYVTSIPTPEEIEAAKSGIEASKGWEVCDRCKSRFQVFPGRREEDGKLASGGSCTYHYGKPYWKDRSTLDPKAKREKKWRCCDQNMGDSPGCTTAEHHVFKVTEVKRLAAVLNFEETPENHRKIPDRPVCIDGEMGYTVHGLELIRLTATAWPNGEGLLDVLVRPVGEVLDLNSRYSGIWPKDMTEAIPYDSTSKAKVQSGKSNLRIVGSPATARALLFELITPKTPIIGHGLENDLNATRFVHPTIIDTALLFPHKAGLPYRNGLKMLMYTYLNRHIQVVREGQIDGHDSKEDANAAGDLVRFEVGRTWEKMRREGWTLRDGEFVPPGRQAGAGGMLTTELLEGRPEKVEDRIFGSKKRSRGDMEGDSEI